MSDTSPANMNDFFERARQHDENRQRAHEQAVREVGQMDHSSNQMPQNMQALVKHMEEVSQREQKIMEEIDPEAHAQARQHKAAEYAQDKIRHMHGHGDAHGQMVNPFEAMKMQQQFEREYLHNHPDHANGPDLLTDFQSQLHKGVDGSEHGIEQIGDKANVFAARTQGTFDGYQAGAASCRPQLSSLDSSELAPSHDTSHENGYDHQASHQNIHDHSM